MELARQGMLLKGACLGGCTQDVRNFLDQTLANIITQQEEGKHGYLNLNTGQKRGFFHPSDDRIKAVLEYMLKPVAPCESTVSRLPL